MLRDIPDDPNLPFLRAIALAYGGRSEEAIQVVEAAYAEWPFEKDQQVAGPYNLLQLIRVYIMPGKHEQALDRLEFLLSKPSYVSPGWIRIDPAFAPLKGNLRFERLSR